MKTKSEQINLYLFELDTLAQHFEEMAQQGWMLANISLWKITYYECMPQQVHFYIDIYHKGGFLNPKIITSDEESYGDFISEYGYELITRTSNFQVFMTHEQAIIPIHSDLESLKKAQFKTILKYEIVNHLYSLLLILLFYLNYTNLSLMSFTLNLTLLLYILYPFLFLIIFLRVYPTFKWLFQRDNYHISVNRMLKRNKLANRLGILLVIALLGAFFVSSSTTMIPTFIILLLCAFAFFILDPLLARFIKKYHSVVAMAICVYMGLFVNINFFFLPPMTEPSNQEASTLTYQDFQNDLPEVVERHVTMEESFIVKETRYYEYYQDNQDQTRDFEKDIHFSYDLYTIKLPLMIGYLQDLALGNRYTLETTGTISDKNSTWQLYQGPYDQCLLWDNRILYISFGHPSKDVNKLTDEQVATIIEQVNEER